MDKQMETVLRENYLKVGPKLCAEMLGISYRACVLRALRLDLGSRRSARRDEIIRFVREWYPKKTAKECSIELGISTQRVRNVASVIGVTGRRVKTRYSEVVNAEFFDTWNPETSYILGFIYADGGLRRDGIALYQNEVEYLEMLRRVMGIRCEVKPHGVRCHAVRFNNCYMADRLREIGVRERKSFGNMIFPVGLPDRLYSHFIRGFFDGDGSVGVYGKWRNLRISLWGQRDFIERIYQDVSRLVGTTGGGVRKGTSKREDFYCCSWGAVEDTRKIWKWLYQDGDVLLLKRKRRILDRYFEQFEAA